MTLANHEDGISEALVVSFEASELSSGLDRANNELMRIRPSALNLLRQRLNQLRDIRNAQASDHVVARPGIVGAIIALGDIAEAGSSDKRIEEGVEEGERLLLCLDPSLVDQRAEAGPNGCAPTRSTDLLDLVVKHEESSLVGICGEADIRHQTVTSRRNTGAALPGWPLKDDALPAATAHPRSLARHLSVCRQLEAGTPHRDDASVRRFVLHLKWAVRAVPGTVGVGTRIAARHENVDSERSELQELLMLHRHFGRGPAKVFLAEP